MTKVDFYVLASAEPTDAYQYACRLVEKAFGMGHRIYVHCRDAEQAGELDALLWSYRPESFIPHALAGQAAADERVVVGHGPDAGDHHDVLINFDEDAPEFFSRFNRVGEVVCQVPSWLQASRVRYKFYRDRGYPLAKHDVRR